MKTQAGFFARAAMLGPLDFLDTSFKGVPHLMAQGPLYFVTIALIATLSIIAFTNNHIYH